LHHLEAPLEAFRTIGQKCEPVDAFRCGYTGHDRAHRPQPVECCMGYRTISNPIACTV
jgi:hypothetical protein